MAQGSSSSPAPDVSRAVLKQAPSAAPFSARSARQFAVMFPAPSLKNDAFAPPKRKKCAAPST